MHRMPHTSRHPAPECSLVGLNIRQNIARGYCLPLLDVPRHQVALAHRGRQRRHAQLLQHDIGLGWVKAVRVMGRQQKQMGSDSAGEARGIGGGGQQQAAAAAAVGSSIIPWRDVRSV